MINGEPQPITDEIRGLYDDAYNTLGGYGERVLGFAQLALDERQFPPTFEFDTENPNFPLVSVFFFFLNFIIIFIYY